MVANHVILCGHEHAKLPRGIKCCVVLRPITVYNIAGKSAQSHSLHSSVLHDLIDQTDGLSKLNSCFLHANSFIFTITMTIHAHIIRELHVW